MTVKVVGWLQEPLISRDKVRTLFVEGDMNGLKLVMAGVGVAVIGASYLLAEKPNFAAPGPGTVTASKVGTNPGMVKSGGPLAPASGDKLACFSGGCFWGVEEYFRHIPGVVSTAVGFTGGTVPNPSYELVCTHTTGHAESVLIEFNPNKISYRQLVDDFWKVHDPTTVDRQGPDEGSNYRSAIWTFDDSQQKDALASVAARQSKEKGPIVTKVSPAKPFYLAEDYHQQYDERTGTNSCPIRE
jgi:peptide-methionine (S)-S-oxide reductase